MHLAKPKMNVTAPTKPSGNPLPLFYAQLSGLGDARIQWIR